MLATILLLQAAKQASVLSFPDPSLDVVKKIWPLPLFYTGNMLFGLGGTKELSLPMLTVLRRFTILMTMVAEFYILGYRSGSTRAEVIWSVLLLVLFLSFFCPLPSGPGCLFSFASTP